MFRTRLISGIILVILAVIVVSTGGALLYGVTMEQVQVVVQPQSVIHSMVEFEDGAVICLLYTSDAADE